MKSHRKKDVTAESRKEKHVGKCVGDQSGKRPNVVANVVWESENVYVISQRRFCSASVVYIASPLTSVVANMFERLFRDHTQD